MRRNLILKLTATHCNTLQHTATHCNTLDTAAQPQAGQQALPKAHFPKHTGPPSFLPFSANSLELFLRGGQKEFLGGGQKGSIILISINLDRIQNLINDKKNGHGHKNRARRHVYDVSIVSHVYHVCTSSIHL